MGQPYPGTEKLAEWSDHIKQTLDVTFPLLFHYESYDRLLRLVRDHPNNDLFREALVHYDHVLESMKCISLLQLSYTKDARSIPEGFRPTCSRHGRSAAFSRPKTAGDIGAFSASPCEDKYYYDIGFSTTIP